MRNGGLSKISAAEQGNAGTTEIDPEPWTALSPRYDGYEPCAGNCILSDYAETEFNIEISERNLPFFDEFVGALILCSVSKRL